MVAITTDGAAVALEAKLSEVWTVQAGAAWKKDQAIAHVRVTATW